MNAMMTRLQEKLDALEKERDESRVRLRKMLEVLQWYAAAHRPEDYLNDNGLRAQEVLQQLGYPWQQWIVDLRETSTQNPKPVQMVDGLPRRIRCDLYTPAENAISRAMNAVEEAGAHPLLTDAVNLLHEAKNKVADFVELGKKDE